MTTTTTFPASVTATAPTSADATAARPRLWTVGLGSGVVAAAATTVTAVAARAVDVPLTVSGEAIPTMGYAQLTLVGAVLGILLARLSRRFAHPRTVFVRTTVALTALSVVPDVLVDASVASRLVLAATHVVAAAIIVPTLARRLAR
ncbi:MAG: DUF6069 family protein [Acidimicrobiales bacterium]